MKSLVILISLLVSFNCIAGDGSSGGGPRLTARTVNMIRNDFTVKVMPDDIVEMIKLRDGRRYRSFGSIHTVGGNLDFIQLRSGEIVDRTDLKAVVVKVK